MKGKLYLLPNLLGDTNPQRVLPDEAIKILHSLDHFIVENIKNARRFIIKCGYPGKIDDIRFFELNKKTDLREIPSFLDPCMKGLNTGLISEAGLPGIADPGAVITSLAHEKRIRVIPFTGPSSVLLSLMASGLNGQSFTFHGYLPIRGKERQQRIRELDKACITTGYTQIFIETPYRNDKLLEDLKRNCSAKTKLCVACELTCENETIITHTIAEWKKERVSFHKRPCIFLLG